MTAFTPKKYQQDPASGGGVLDSVEAYFKACHEHGNAALAFSALTDALWGRALPYHQLEGFARAMPYFCVRVPTGGGKTWLAARSVALINTHLLRTPHSVILWLVPSQPIREQTLRGLKDRNHPLHDALADAGPVTVLDLAQAKSLTRATLDTSTVVIVATRQAFQVEDRESRKVYESSGALMHHFENLTAAQRASLLRDSDDTAPYSLANVLRLRRPFVIVDEAHNSRTELAFDTLARFAPSGIMELTATPDTERNPSNVLHSVSAAQLKAEQMIKLPVLLEAEPDWQQCLADAIAQRDVLQRLADDERRGGGDESAYLRPIVLIQSEPRRSGLDTLDVERVRAELQNNHRIAPHEIVVATGDERGLDAIDAAYTLGIADPACPVKFVITQRALAEGWDCPFAYILVSLASLQSATAIEQLLGRVLRQPNARHRAAKELNQSYAFVVSASFAETAHALRDRLVQGAGFDRKEAAEFVAPARPDQRSLDLEGMGGRVRITPVVVALRETPDLKAVAKPIRDKLAFDRRLGTLTLRAPLSPAESEALQQAVGTPEAKQAIARAAEQSRSTAIEYFATPAERGERLQVPQLALRVHGELQLFDDPTLLGYPWDLSRFDCAPTQTQLDELNAAHKASEGGTIDVDAGSGRLTTRFLPELQRDLGLAYVLERWDTPKLAAWLCRHVVDPTLTHESRLAFVLGWLSELLERPGFGLARANQQKFLLRKLLQARIDELRDEAARRAFQQSLFGEGNADRVAVGDAFAYDFRPEAYAPSADYDNRFGSFDFRKHFYGRIGDFDSDEEFQCACWLDTQAQLGRFQFWVRNLARREGASFFMQKARGRFYPDFICKLNDGTILIVEYKGADRWDAAKDDREIGHLWAELSSGAARFVMTTNRNWSAIGAKLEP